MQFSLNKATIPQWLFGFKKIGPFKIQVRIKLCIFPGSNLIISCLALQDFQIITWPVLSFKDHLNRKRYQIFKLDLNQLLHQKKLSELQLQTCMKLSWKTVKQTQLLKKFDWKPSWPKKISLQSFVTDWQTRAWTKSIHAQILQNKLKWTRL